MWIDFDQLDEETQARITSLGNISISEPAKLALDQVDIEPLELLSKFVKGDYGLVKHEAAWNNDVAMYARQGEAVAEYELNGRQLVVKTTWNQVVTKIELKEEQDEPAREC